MRRKLLLSHLATAVIVVALVRVVADWVVMPQLKALPHGNAQARQILDDLGIVLLVAGLTVAAATFWLVDILILRRVKSLGQQLNTMAVAADASRRVNSDGDDMAVIAQPVNHLLGSLQSAQAELAERQTQLATSEQRLSLALEATGDGLWDYNLGDRTFFSDTYYHMLGYPAEGDHLQPDNWLKLVHPADEPAVQAAMLDVRLQKADLLATEMRMLTAAGKWKWVFLRGRVISRNADGIPQRMIGTVQDIDRRRQAEEAIRENQELFRNAFEESAVGMSLTLPDGRLMRVNRRLCEMLGYSEAELLQLKFQDVTHPEDLGNNVGMVQAIITGENKHFALEKRYVRKDGQIVWALVNATVALDAEKKPQYIIGQVEDITERKRAALLLHENQELFRNAFEESAVGMSLTLPDGRLMRVNRRLCEILGYTEAELLRLTFQDITHPDDVKTDEAFVQSILSGERQHYSMEKRYIRQDGKTVWVMLNVGVVLDAKKTPLYLISQVQDITQRKQNEIDLTAYAKRLLETKEELERSTAELASKTAEAEAAQEAAEHANRTKSAFLANMSHEIRTPMGAIIGFANLLLDQRLPERERVRCIETIARNGQHLLGLINDILDLSKIEANKMSVEYIECDPAQLVSDVEATTAGRAFDKNLPLIFKVAPDVPRRVRADPTRLRQVLLNLVSNAIKFTHAGEVRVELHRCTLDGGAEGLKFTVTDTGIGISRQQLGRLFEPFSQADVSTTRRFGGTGLGLAISKRLVEMMDGRIKVRSELGRGSSFEVTLPAPVCDPEPARSKSTKPTKPALRPGLRVLLAEDGADNQRLITFYLQHAGIEFEVADNGRRAVECAAAAAAAGRPFDLVLMDMQMPEMDGVAATAALQANGLMMPVVALTAHGTEEARAQSLQAGCREHLVKPVDHDTLLATIARFTVGDADAAAKPPVLTSSLAGDPRFADLLSQYVAELPCQVSKLSDFVLTPYDAGLRRLLHQIKGAGGGYGLWPLSTAAERAEAAFDESAVKSLVRHVEELIRLMRSVQGYDSGRERVNGSARIDH